MEIKKKEPWIYIISGKAKSGKNTIAKVINQYLQNQNQKGAILAYAFYIKAYTKTITDWDGNENTKPRSFLQKLGTEVIRKKINSHFFTNRMLEDIQVYSYFFDYLIISDARTKEEIEEIKKNYNQVVTIYIERPNYDNGLTPDQKNHSTELELGDYPYFDYHIVNHSQREDLENKIIEIMEEIKNEFER